MSVFATLRRPPPDFNTRVSNAYGKTKMVDKTLKFFGSGLGFASNLLAYSETAQPVATALGSLGKGFSVVRSGFKIFDALQDISTPTGDEHETRMKWIQLVGYTAADLFAPVMFAESQGLFTFDKQTKDVLGYVSGSFALLGLVTNTVNASYQIHLAREKAAKLGDVIENNNVEAKASSLLQRRNEVEANLRTLKVQLDEVKRKIVASHETDIDTSERGVVQQLAPEQLVHEAQEIQELIDQKSAEIRVLEEPLKIAEALIISQETVFEIILKNALTIVEKIFDIIAVVFSFIVSMFSPALFVPIMGGIGVVSASFALTKLWRETGVDPESAVILKDTLKWVDRTSDIAHIFGEMPA